MSGFGGSGGGGFFGSNNNNAPPFGSANQAPQPMFGASPTTAAPAGFGQPAAATAQPSFGQPGFGATPMTQPAFGTAPTTSGFGGGFGASPPASTGFGTPPPPAFGTAATTTTTSSNPFGSVSQPSGAFSGGFGQSSSIAAPSSFGGQQQQQVAPPTAPTFGSNNNPFGNTVVAAPAPSFGHQTAPNPFGNNATTTAPTNTPNFSFGFSSNVATTTTTTTNAPSGGGFGGMQQQQQQQFGSSPFGNTASTFVATTTSSSSPIQQSTTSNPFNSDDDMGTGNGGTGNGGGDDSDMGDASSAAVVWSRSSTNSPKGDDDDNDDNKNDKLKELAKMKKELEAKKKKLLERKKKRDAGDSSSSRPTSPLLDTKAIAARNAIRFGPSGGGGSTSPTSSKLKLAPSLKSSSKSTTTMDGDNNNDDDAFDEPVDLRDAVALVGTCKYMCPDDELKQRTDENDIKLLERPLPGELHPPNWTLRNTAVKRFRRSAADYKLNVPEWVRDADVLERTVSYLEEWVMERDRQGPDPRFVNQPNPPSLDVYQFIWNRTRMIRKDFILQNYVGTGGLCDARAVRCHERIARWHAMCEHQLSHIPEFVKAQSQQNIAELGQAMKTLNQFYDDTMGRSTIEVADAENGQETRKVQEYKGPIHGCEHATVQGVSPVDFDGKPLRNDETCLSKRIVGAAAGSWSHGTAEPEMRALYIILTLDNDGGMEVLRYAANLSREKPHVFYSGPVQLAMQIFKAKQEMNYARFFAILRAPTTPYLMACLMFKHVEEMRKVAFRIMSRTYGYKRSGESGESAQYDQYQIERLVRLLNFESNKEAREACKFYNITVKGQKVRSRSSPEPVVVELVFWRHSKFAEPRDEAKGITLSLKPWKMTRTIESKLQGATRLAVCRGEVSGDGAWLPADQVQPLSKGTLGVSASSVAEAAKAKALAAQALEAERLRRKQEEEMKRLMELEARKKQEAARLEAERQRRRAEEEKARRLLEEKKRRLEEKRQQEEAARKAAEEAERRRKEEEERKKAEEERKARELERKRREEEEKRRRLEEEARRKAEEEERERLRRIQAELERKRREEEEAERRRREAEEAERRRKEAEERRRLELLRRKQEEERRRKRAEERRVAAEWQLKMDAARKVLLWRRLKQVCEPQLRQERSRLSLESLDPSRFVDNQITIPATSYMEPPSQDEKNEPMNIHEFLDWLCREEREPIDFNAMLCERLLADDGQSSSAATDVFKVVVVVPHVGEGVQAEGVFELLHKWIGKRLQYGQISSGGRSESSSFHVIRSVVVPQSSEKSCRGVDMVLLVVPPFAGGLGTSISDVTSALSGAPDNIPIVALNLNSFSDAKSQEIIDKTDAQHIVSLDGDDDGDFDGALQTTMNLVAQQLAVNNQDHRLVPVSVRTLVSKCIHRAFRRGPRDGSNLSTVVERARSTLEPLLVALESTAAQFAPRMWPSAAFANADGGAIENYFGPNSHLPSQNWHETLRRQHVEPCTDLADYLLQQPLPNILETLLENAPLLVTSHCQSLMTARLYCSCLIEAFQWWPRQQEVPEPIVFIPKGMVDEVFKYVEEQIGPSDESTAYEENNKASGVDFNLTTISNVETSDAGVYSETGTDMAGEDKRLTGKAAVASPPKQLQAEHALPQSSPSHDESILVRSKRILDSANEVIMGSPWKKTKRSVSSSSVEASRAFTAKLEALLMDDRHRMLPRIGLTTTSSPSH